MAVAAIRPSVLPASVVLVDHEPEILDLLRRTLAIEGYRIVATTSTTDALWLLDHDHIDLVLADVVTGLDIVLGVRRSNPTVIRIVMTASPCADANEAEVHDYLTRPWDPVDLRAMIRDALAARLVIATKHLVPVDGVELSPRLRQTLDALMTGASEKQIASHLGISPHTTHQYIKALFRRFSVTSRPELMARVLRR